MKKALWCELMFVAFLSVSCSPAAYAFAATASYKMGDLASAERYVMGLSDWMRDIFHMCAFSATKGSSS
jgi:hypothetical protein